MNREEELARAKEMEQKLRKTAIAGHKDNLEMAEFWQSRIRQLEKDLPVTLRDNAGPLTTENGQLMLDSPTPPNVQRSGLSGHWDDAPIVDGKTLPLGADEQMAYDTNHTLEPGIYIRYGSDKGSFLLPVSEDFHLGRDNPKLKEVFDQMALPHEYNPESWNVVNVHEPIDGCKLSIIGNQKGFGLDENGNPMVKGGLMQYELPEGESIDGESNKMTMTRMPKSWMQSNVDDKIDSPSLPGEPDLDNIPLATGDGSSFHDDPPPSPPGGGNGLTSRDSNSSLQNTNDNRVDESVDISSVEDAHMDATTIADPGTVSGMTGISSQNSIQAAPIAPSATLGDRYRSSYDDRIRQTPSLESNRWVGERGESVCVPQSDAARQIMEERGISGVQYQDGVPDFSPFSESTVKLGYMTDARHSQGLAAGRDGGKTIYAHLEDGETVSTSHHADTSSMTDLHMKYDKPGNFEQADVLTAEQWTADGRNGKEWTAEDVAQYRQDHGLTWHECNDMETMQMIPEAINTDFGHLGGVGEVKETQRIVDEALRDYDEGQMVEAEDYDRMSPEELKAVPREHGHYTDDGVWIPEDRPIVSVDGEFEQDEQKEPVAEEINPDSDKGYLSAEHNEGNQVDVLTAQTGDDIDQPEQDTPELQDATPEAFTENVVPDNRSVDQMENDSNFEDVEQPEDFTQELPDSGLDAKTKEQAAQEVAEQEVEEPAAQETDEQVAEEQVAQETAEQEVEEQAVQEAAEQEPEEQVAQEVFEQEVAEPAAQENAEWEAEEPVAQEAAEQEVEEQVAQGAAEQEAEEQAAQEAAEWETEEPAAQEEAEQEAEEQATQAVAEQEAEEQAAQEVAEQEIEEQAAQEAVEQETEEQVAQEVAEQEAEEQAAQEAAEQEVAEPAAQEEVEQETEEQVTQEVTEQEAVEQEIEEQVVQEAAEQEVEEPAAQEAVEQEATQEVVEEEAEEQAAQEAAEQEAEEPAEQEVAEQEVEEQGAQEEAEPEPEEQAAQEVIEQDVEEPAEQEAAEQEVEEPAAQEAAEQETAQEVAEQEAEEPAEQEVAEQEVEEQVTQEEAEQETEEQAAQEVVEQAAQEAAEQEAEEQATQETAEQEVEEQVAQEAAEQEVDKPAVQEEAEQEIEEQAAQEAVEQETEEQATQEVTEQEAEEQATQEAAEQEVYEEFADEHQEEDFSESEEYSDLADKPVNESNDDADYSDLTDDVIDDYADDSADYSDIADDIDPGSDDASSFDNVDTSFDAGDTGSFDGGDDSIE